MRSIQIILFWDPPATLTTELCSSSFCWPHVCRSVKLQPTVLHTQILHILLADLCLLSILSMPDSDLNDPIHANAPFRVEQPHSHKCPFHSWMAPSTPMPLSQLKGPIHTNAPFTAERPHSCQCPIGCPFFCKFLTSRGGIPVSWKFWRGHVLPTCLHHLLCTFL